MARSNLFFATLALAAVTGAFGRDLLQSTQTVRWVVPANGIATTTNIPVGGSITFTWTTSHDVREIPSDTCPSSFVNGTNIKQLGARSNGGSTIVQFPTAGTRHFACSVSTHCQEGQRLTVKVGSASPALAPGPSRYGQSYGGGVSCGGNSTSGSGYGGSSGSSSNYTGNSTYGGSATSTSTPSAEEESSSYGGGDSSYGGGGANYGGGTSDKYGRKLRSAALY